MKLANLFLAIALVPAFFGLTTTAKADTVKARCDVYPKGEDLATSSGLCDFSQRQGAVSIQLESGQRYDISPVGDRPGNYQDSEWSSCLSAIWTGRQRANLSPRQ